MLSSDGTYSINLCYEAYFGKAIDITADDLVEACEIAMETADDARDWNDTLVHHRTG